MHKTQINLKIEKKRTEGDLGIGEIANVLRGIQDTVYHIGESLYMGKEFRVAGKRNKIIEKRTRLIFKHVELSSFHSIISGEFQRALQDKTLVEESIEIFGSVLYYLNDSDTPEEKIKNLLPDPLHRTRIIKDIANFWPGAENNYKIEIEAPNLGKKILDDKRRKIILNMSEIKQEEIIKKEIIGVLGGGHFIKKRKFEIESPDGKIICEYDKRLQDKVIKNIAKPVIVEAIIPVSTAKTKKSPKVFSIEPLKKIPLSRIVSERGEIKLKKEINVDVSFKDDIWILEYPKLKIISYGEKYEEVMEEFQNDFFVLYEHYYLGNPSKMKGNALKIREFFKEYVGGG